MTHVRIVAPASVPDRPIVLCWFPGGGMSSRYFDLDPPYDMAGHLAGLGFVNLLVDHPAVGRGLVPDDPWTLTPEAVADADADAVRRALGELDLDDPVVIGGGHSMGAMLVVHQEAPSYLSGTTDVTLHVVRGGFHNSNVADRRVELWDRLALWARTVPA